jgi:SAM-dependent methyltransferase
LWPNSHNPWFGEPVGAGLLAAETALLDEALDDVFGWELLQVGLWGAPRGLIRACRTRRAVVIADAPEASDGVDVLARIPQLPVANATVDAVLLPHTLEFTADPQAMIREADRVLAGEGQLIVMGFRPLSLWGLRATAARGNFPPGLKRLLREGRVRDWLALLGYEIVTLRHYLYAAPWASAHPSASRGGRLLKRGLLNPLPAGAYILKARKRVYTMTPIRLKPRERQQVLGALVKPTTPRAQP